MDFDALKNINNEVERQVKEKISKMSRKEIEFRATQYKKKNQIKNWVFAILLFTLAIGLLCIIPVLLSDSENMPSFTWLALAIMFMCAVAEGIYLLVQISGMNKKSNADIVSMKLRGDLAKSSQSRIEMLKQQGKLFDADFTVSKMLPVGVTGWTSNKILVDFEHEKFIYKQGNKQSPTYNFSDIINYEIYENGKSKVQGRAGSALIGGAFFGLGGLIVGSSMSRGIHEKCTQLKLIIRINNPQTPQIEIPYIENLEYDKSSLAYSKAIENLQELCSFLEYIMNAKTLEQSANTQSQSCTTEKNSKEQLKELKELLDSDLITLEDYEQKKKQILGL